MNPLIRWNDDRLDDLAAKVEHVARQQEAVSDIKAELVGLRAEVENADEHAVQALAELQNLKRGLETDRTNQAKERKSDRRWMIGTALTTAGLIIAALAVFFG